MIAGEIVKIMAETNSASDHSLLWGHVIEFWDRLGIQALLWGAILGVVALLLTAGSAYVLYRVADVAQKDLEKETQTSEERLGVAQADIAKASAQIAEAQARTKEAELKLEQLRAKLVRRDVNFDAIAKALEGKPKEKFEIQYAGGDPDTYRLATRIWQALGNGGWKAVGFPNLIEPNTVSLASSGGVYVVLHTLGPQSLWQHPFATLNEAFGDSLGGHLIISGDSNVPEDVVRIVVGPREPMEPERHVIRLMPQPKQ